MIGRHCPEENGKRRDVVGFDRRCRERWQTAGRGEAIVVVCHFLPRHMAQARLLRVAGGHARQQVRKGLKIGMTIAIDRAVTCKRHEIQNPGSVGLDLLVRRVAGTQLNPPV